MIINELHADMAKRVPFLGARINGAALTTGDGNVEERTRSWAGRTVQSSVKQAH